MNTSNILAAALFACMLGFAAGADAQDAGKEHSMTGCLARGDDSGTFKLTDVASGPSVVAIASTTANLTPHLGHKVEITGVAVPGKGNVHTMKVSGVKMISAVCP